MDKEITKADQSQDTATNASIPAKDHKHDKHTALLVCGAALLVLVGLGAGLLLHRGTDDRRIPMFGGMVEKGIMNTGGPRAGMNTTVNPTDGSTVTRLIGVVTQVNGDSFTIAGNGTTKTIKTDSNTVYNTTDKKVNVNDSVIVTGTDSNGTFTATFIRIVNANQ